MQCLGLKPRRPSCITTSISDSVWPQCEKVSEDIRVRFTASHDSAGERLPSQRHAAPHRKERTTDVRTLQANISQVMTQEVALTRVQYNGAATLPWAPLRGQSGQAFGSQDTTLAWTRRQFNSAASFPAFGKWIGTVRSTMVQM